MTLREKLESALGPVLAGDLKPHAARGALFHVGGSLHLVDVAEAVAEDAVPKVQAWLDAGDLRRVTTSDVEAWAEATQGPAFKAVVVAPYVLVQEGET